MTAPFAQILLRKEPAYRREAFVSGLRKLGYVIPDGRSALLHPRSPEDLLVLWNKKRGSDETQANEWERRGGTVIVAENAYLQKVDKTAYAISTHGHNGSGWFPFDLSEGRFQKLGYELKPWREGGGYVLVCGQRGIGSELMASPPQWGENVFRKLQSGGVKVKLRQHPGNFAPKVPLLDDFAGARRVHIWSSSAGVAALIEGIPVEFDAPHWICGRHANRVDALEHMAQGQWSVAEIESGEPFARMRDAGWGPRVWV